ncbi:MAG: beta strand repeat-containing protein [Acidimicrobiales bacterium]
MSRPLVKMVAAGAVMVAAALPVAVISASPAGAAGAPTISCAWSPSILTSCITYGYAVVEQGSVATVDFNGAGFANDFGAVTISTTAPGVTVSGAHETSSTFAQATFTATTATTPGFYPITLTDDHGTVTLANGLGIIAGPVITSVTPAVLAPAFTQTITIHGSGFAGFDTLYLTDPSGNTTTPAFTFVSPGTLTLTIPGSSAAGVWAVQIYDGNAYSNFGTFTMSGPIITGITPLTGLLIPGSGQSTQAVTLTGSGFEPGAHITLGTAGSFFSTDSLNPADNVPAGGTFVPLNGISPYPTGLRITSDNGGIVNTTTETPFTEAPNTPTQPADFSFPGPVGSNYFYVPATTNINVGDPVTDSFFGLAGLNNAIPDGTTVTGVAGGTDSIGFGADAHSWYKITISHNTLYSDCPASVGGDQVNNANGLCNTFAPIGSMVSETTVLPIGGTSTTLTLAGSPAGTTIALDAGDSITATNSAAQSQTFTVATGSGPGLVTFNQSSNFLFDVATTKWTTPAPYFDGGVANTPDGIQTTTGEGVDINPLSEDLAYVVNVYHSWLTLSAPAAGFVSGFFAGPENIYFGDTHITVNSNAGLSLGMSVTGTGIPGGTTIAGIAGDNLTLNNPTLPTPPYAPLNFAYGASVVGPTGVTYVSPTTYTFNVTVFAGAAPGQVGVTLTNVDGGTTYVPLLLGIGEPGVLSSAPQISSSDIDLNYGQNTFTVTTTNYPLTLGSTVSVNEGGAFPLSGTVLAVGGGGSIATVSLYVPDTQSTTMALPASSGATSIVVAGSGLGLAGTTLTLVNGASSVNVASGGVAANTPAAGYATVTVAALPAGFGAGTVVEFPYPPAFGTATFTVNNGGGTPESTFADISAVGNTISSAGFQTIGGPAVDTPLENTSPSDSQFGGDVLAGGSVSGYLTMPGFNFGAGSSITFNSPSGPSGVTGTVTPVNKDTAYVSANLPAAVAVPGELLGSPVAITGTSVTLVPVGGVNINLANGSSITATNTLSQTQTFTVASYNSGTFVVTLNQPATFTFGAGTEWSGPGIVSTNPVNFSATVGNGSGGVQIIGSAFSLANGITLTGVSPAVVGAGATAFPVTFTGSFVAGGKYTLTSSVAGVTFSSVVASAGTLTALVTVASNVAAGNVTVTATSSDGDGGATLPNSSFPLTTMSVVAGPTITSVVTGASSLGAGGFTQVTITGTGFSTANGDTIFVLAGSGENAGAPDTGTVNGVHGIGNAGTCNGAAVSSTSIVCTLFVGLGASPGTDSFQVQDQVTGGTSNVAGSITITGVSATATAPTLVDTNYNDVGAGGTFQVTLSGLAVTPTVAAGMSCSVSIIDPVIGYLFTDACDSAPTYATANSVNVVSDLSLHGFAGDTLVITLVSPAGQSFDAPPVTLAHEAPTSVLAVPTTALIPGTCNNVVTIVSTSTNQYRGWFLSTTTLAFSGSGVTITPVSITPNTLTVSICLTASASVGTFTVQTTGFGTAVVPNLTVTSGPTITNGPFSRLTGTSSTLHITGTGFEFGAVVSASIAGFATFGAAVVTGSTSITVPVTVATNSGPNPIVANLTVTNPDASAATLVGGLIITPNPAITGGPYFVPTFSTGIQYFVSGSGFQAGMVCTSSNSAYTVSVVGVGPTTVNLWVTTTSAATSGTSSTITCTNPDGGKTSFTLNGGPAPTPPLTVTHTFGRPAKIGGSRAFNIDGTNMSDISVSVNRSFITVHIIQNTATVVTVGITVKKGVKPGAAVLTLSNANGTVHVAFSYKK